MRNLKSFQFLCIVAVFLISAITYAGTIQLPKTGQTKCYDTASTKIACAGTGQDGDIQAGIAWPSLRFVDNGDETITDKLTGLIWTKDGNLIETKDPDFNNDGILRYGRVRWKNALDYVAKLNAESYLGYTDWRLPNVNELESLINVDKSGISIWLNSQGFSNVTSDSYWSSSTYAYDTGSAWVVSMWMGTLDDAAKDDASCFVWPIRSGQSESFGNLVIPQTGQTNCYDTAGDEIVCTGTGQDGDIQAGVAWPNPRFTDNGNGTVTDNLTTLMWTKDANLIETRNPDFDKDYATNGRVKWQHALDYVAKLNAEVYLGYTDWRLPNRKELRSLINYSNYNPALQIDHPFTNLSSDYWSSSTDYFFGNRAWVVGMWNGYINSPGKDGIDLYGWPVRGGQFGSLGYLVISVNPNSGEEGKTFGATITGVNFTGATAISFGSGITVNSFTVDSDTQITTNITIDSLATTGQRDVSVTTANGTGTLTGGFKITATVVCSNKKPAIIKLSKTKGKAGNVITITGKNFCSGGGQVFFGKIETLSSAWSDKSITVIVPIMTVGNKGKTVQVKVINANGISSITKPFKVMPVK